MFAYITHYRETIGHIFAKPFGFAKVMVVESYIVH